MFKKIVNKYTIILTVVIALIVAGYFIYTNSQQVKVKQVNLKNELVQKTVSASGKIEAENASDLSFRTVAKLASINVKEGDTVTKGQLLASADLNSAYQTAKSYEAALEQAKTERNKYIENYADNLEGAGGRTNYELNLKKLNEAVNQAQATLSAQQSIFLNYYIYAPIDGTVVEVTKEIGETISTGETIVKIADLNNLYFSANVDQEDLGLITKDQKTVVTLDAFEEKEFMGTVLQVQNFLKQGNDTVEVKINFDKNNLNVLYGMSGDAKIIISEIQTDNALQFDYINSDDDKKTYVWVVNNKKLAKKYVTIDLEGDLYTTVKEDLSKDTIVIPVDTKQVLKEGTEVTISK